MVAFGLELDKPVAGLRWPPKPISSSRVRFRRAIFCLRTR